MAIITEVKKGCVIKHQNDLYLVTDARFTNPGKGSPFVTAKMKSITSGKGTEMTYKAVDEINIVEVQKQKLQYLYKNGDFYSFMDNETYETHELEAEIVGEDGKYLKDGMEVYGSIFEGRVVAITIPPKVQYKVTEAAPAVKGNTASSGRLMKDVTLENGLVARVPIFIKEGETILINTDTGEYCERINE